MLVVWCVIGCYHLQHLNCAFKFQNQYCSNFLLISQKDEVFNEATDDSFRNAVAVMPLFARSVAAELREASDQVGKSYH